MGIPRMGILVIQSSHVSVIKTSGYQGSHLKSHIRSMDTCEMCELEVNVFGLARKGIRISEQAIKLQGSLAPEGQ